MIKTGDEIEVKPISKCPNMGGVFVVGYLTKNGIVYGCSETCDGYELPFNFIEDIKIIGHRKKA